MQREIKFRGQRADTKEWVYGYLFGSWEQRYILWGTTNGIPNMIEVIPKTVGQYTGINDNSDCLYEEQEDKEIYTDDIVSVSYEGKTVKARVDFGLGMYTLVSNEFSDGYIPIAEVSNQDREYEWINGLVIGNIYDNPELLTQSPTDTDQNQN